MKKITTFLTLLIFATNLSAQSTIANSTFFDDTTNATWVKVLTLAVTADGVSSQAAQTTTINITSLPTGGANYRVYKTTANGGDFFGNAQALSVGTNTITVGAVGFDRTVKLQFNSAEIGFDALSINGNDIYYPDTSIGGSNLFDDTTNATYPRILTLAVLADGASSQTAQTATINITSLPTGGANYRVYKTTANGGDFFGNPQALSVGSNTITVGAVGFNRVVKLQFTGPSTEFSALSVNGASLDITEVTFSSVKVYPNPATDTIFVEGVENIKSMKVYSILGSLEKEVFNTNQIDISELSTGIHLIKVDNGTVFTKKIIKQ